MCLNSGPFFNKFPLRGCGGRVAALFQLPPAGSPRLLMPFGIRAASLATRWLSCVAVQVAQACTPRGGESLRLHRLFLTHLLGSSVPSGGCLNSDRTYIVSWVLPSLPVAVSFVGFFRPFRWLFYFSNSLSPRLKVSRCRLAQYTKRISLPHPCDSSVSPSFATPAFEAKNDRAEGCSLYFMNRKRIRQTDIKR